MRCLKLKCIQSDRIVYFEKIENYVFIASSASQIFCKAGVVSCN